MESAPDQAARDNAGGAPAPRTGIKNVRQHGHHAELVLLARLLGDVLVDDLWDPEDKGWLEGRVTRDQRQACKRRLRTITLTKEQSNLKDKTFLKERFLVRCV